MHPANKASKTREVYELAPSRNPSLLSRNCRSAPSTPGPSSPKCPFGHRQNLESAMRSAYPDTGEPMETSGRWPQASQEETQLQGCSKLQNALTQSSQAPDHPLIRVQGTEVVDQRGADGFVGDYVGPAHLWEPGLCVLAPPTPSSSARKAQPCLNPVRFKLDEPVT